MNMNISGIAKIWREGRVGTSLKWK